MPTHMYPPVSICWTWLSAAVGARSDVSDCGALPLPEGARADAAADRGEDVPHTDGGVGHLGPLSFDYFGSTPRRPTGPGARVLHAGELVREGPLTRAPGPPTGTAA